MARRGEHQGSLFAPTVARDASSPGRAGAPAPRMLQIGEAAEALGVSRATLRNWDRRGKLIATRHPLNNYRLYHWDDVSRLRDELADGILAPQPAGEAPRRAETRFDIEFVAPLALDEKQIQQSYRPYIQVHKWFARRPGSLFRALLLAEFGDDRPLRDAYFDGQDLSAFTILDPFMGGGTPLLEANRVGMNVVGCDINPMATWIVRQELAPLDAQSLRRHADDVIARVQEDIEDLYDTACLKCGGSAIVKYFLWVKQLPCPACEEAIELLPGYLIASDARHPAFVVFCPGCRDLFEVPERPQRGDALTCTACRQTFEAEPVASGNRYACRACGHGGKYPADLRRLGPPQHALIAMEYHCQVCKPDHTGRFFKAPDDDDLRRHAHALEAFAASPESDLIPDDEVPEGDETTRLHRWGYRRFRDLFSERQLLSLAKLAAAIRDVPDEQARHALATIFSDFLRYQNMLARYDTYALKCQDIFAVHGFPVGLMQCENNVIGIPKVGSGGFRHFLEKYVAAKDYNTAPYETLKVGGRKRRIYVHGERIGATFCDGMPTAAAGREARIESDSVERLDLPASSVDAVITDPPYFSNVQYAELMDFCYVWLKRLLGDDVSYFENGTTRNALELTGNKKSAGRDLADFCEGLSRVYRAAARALKPGGLFAFTYHHNRVSGYLPIAVALLDAGLEVTASLPCPAEMKASLHIHGTGSSVVDTILCARKKKRGQRHAGAARNHLAGTLNLQAESLRRGGVALTAGDLRCMALGLVTVRAVDQLASGWSRKPVTATRLARAEGAFNSVLAPFGGVDGLVATVGGA